MAVCPQAGHGVCEVKVSTGGNKPENAGKSYATCKVCDPARGKFVGWVDATTGLIIKDAPRTAAFKPMAKQAPVAPPASGVPTPFCPTNAQLLQELQQIKAMHVDTRQWLHDTFVAPHQQPESNAPTADPQ